MARVQMAGARTSGAQAEDARTAAAQAEDPQAGRAGAAPRILVIDSYDSFTYNLVHQIARASGVRPQVVAHDWAGWTPEALDGVDGVVLSPGPGTPARPEDTGIGPEVLAAALARGDLPVLGVCLGHQTLAHALGAAVVRAPEPRHGRTSSVHHGGEGVFAGVPNPFTAVRYHSLTVADETELPDDLRVTARTEDGLIMGLAHARLPLWGVQFHPESVLTAWGDRLLENFIGLVRAHGRENRGRAQSQAPAGTTAEDGCAPLPRTVAESAQAGPASGRERSHPISEGEPTRLTQEADRSRLSAEEERPRRRCLRTRELVSEASAEVLFDALYGGQECAVWLDGNLPGDPRGRFSVMGAPTGPRAALAWADVATGTVTVRSADGQAERRTGFFDWLDAEMRGQTPVAEAVPGCSFALGWAGFLGYELKAECGGRAVHRADTPDAAFAFLDRALVLDAQTQTVHLLALAAEEPGGEEHGGAEHGDEGPGRGAHSGDEARGDEAAERWLAETAALIAELDAGGEPDGGRPAATPGRPAPGRAVCPRHPRAEYLSRIREVQELIAAGETYEACLTNRLETETDQDPWAAYLRLRAQNPAPFGAYLRFPGLGDRAAFAVLSTSPERFLRIDAGGRAESSPIKGTRPRGRTGAEDAALRDGLADAEKDRSENLMIVDLVRNDLGRTAVTGSVRVERLFAVESYATVHQLVSTVSAQLAPEHSPVECVRAAFPPGSMTGAPKVRTMELLDELEGGPRGVYSGAIGWFSLSGAVELSVVIRTLVQSAGGTTGDRLSYGVGGAIVALSDPEEEHAETMVKSAPLLRLLEEDGHV
ncbi:aminodeoxychorismate synthase component I [Brevibacterium album]|uniref:aminodeoxychorismate synthase component I n=1 Tax=Brevibacterium album TaxID=417948 RepID=UPI0003F5A843|nr:aminodeoxychorismate synthase component I [Brevibacterium album]